MSPTQKWQRSLASHTPKIVERSLATGQRFHKEAKRPEYLTSGLANDLSRFFGVWLGIFTTFAFYEGP